MNAPLNCVGPFAPSARNGDCPGRQARNVTDRSPSEGKYGSESLKSDGSYRRARRFCSDDGTVIVTSCPSVTTTSQIRSRAAGVTIEVGTRLSRGQPEPHER